MSPRITRRHVMTSAASLPILTLGAGLAVAKPSLQGARMARANRFRLGAFEITTLLAGSGAIEKPQEIFGMNASAEDFKTLSDAAFLPADRGQSFMIPVLVNTGEALVLFDTGMTPEGITLALAEAGLTADAIDVVVLTHMHGDHIGGLADSGGSPTFSNARYITGRVEYDHWAAAGNERFDKLVKPLEDKIEKIEDGASPIAGLTAIMAPGHTPGHMVWRVESEGKALMLIADTANHYVWSVGRPDWEVRYDADKAKAAETRWKVLGQIAEERLPFIGYHMPFPGVGYLVKEDAGFRYVAASYQMMLP